MNSLIRGTVVARAESLLSEAATLKDVEHAGLRGRFREMLLDKLIRPWLPPYCKVGSGTIIDSDGTRRELSEDDLIICDPGLAPPLLLSERDGIFPVESVLQKIEVKSRLTREDMRQALCSATGVHKLKMLPPQADRIPERVVCAVFAYSSDMEGDELNRMLECIQELKLESELPPIPMLCVVGKGTWFKASSDKPRFERGWVVAKPKSDHNEIVMFVSAMVNTVKITRDSRGRPFWGPYITDINSDVDSV